jgi:hypothetical protein
MNLVSLKRDTGEDCSPCPMSNYGGSLRVYLDDDQCEALGITKALAAGTRVTISAKAIVVSSTSSVEDDGDDAGPDISLSIQLTEMGVEVGAMVKNAAEVLYGGQS